MMPPISSEMNANTNPPDHIIKVHIYEDALDLTNGWEIWSLKDVIGVLKNMSLMTKFWINYLWRCRSDLKMKLMWKITRIPFVEFDIPS